ncbi:MAG TPA: biotin-dependent carboxyltransferase family protein [Nitrospiraceae bacterium]|nr:biotin-dependent carboxyltransferase family protein [Nitrospiraceae bacterium]
MPDQSGFFIHRSGLFTTIQDLGRYGYQHFGVSVSGAMDRTGLRIGNRIVGNPDGAAALEMTLQGPDVEFTGDAIIAVTGADLSPSLNGDLMPMWSAVAVRGVDRLRFGPRRQGCRSYVCVRGGLDVPAVLGSRSTDVRAGIGGLGGRRLGKGDEVYFGTCIRKTSRPLGWEFPVDARPEYSTAPALRVMPGPQAECFSQDAMDTLFTNVYVVAPDSDRIGFRLDGAPIAHRGSMEWISDATAAGTIQVPADRRPILLMADCQTTGGYPKIASVMSVDMGQAGQLAPGDRVRFAPITAEEALILFRKEREKLDHILPPIAP